MRRQGQSLTAKYEYVPLAQQSVHPLSTKSNVVVERFGMQMGRTHTLGNASTNNAGTRGVTEPTDFISNAVIERPGKAQTLQQQFETLKRKIKEVQNKNERILQKIHNTQEMQRKRSLDRKPISVEIAYQPQISEAHIRGSHRNEEYDRLQRNKNFSKQSRDRRSAINSEKQQKKESRQQMVEVKHIVKELQSKNLYVSSLLEQERVQKDTVTSQLELVEEKLKKEQFRLETVKSSFRNYAECCRQIFQGQLDRFVDSVLNKLLQMDKKNKKNGDKLESFAKKLQRHREDLRSINIHRNESAFPEMSSMIQRQDWQTEKLKSKDLDNLVVKYEQLIKTKNEECEGLIARSKQKQKEYTDQKAFFDRLKDQKRRYQLQAEEKIADLESTVSILTNQNKTLRIELSKMFTKKMPVQQSKLSMKSITSDMRDQFDRKDDMIFELTNKVNTYQKTIVEKNRVVIALEKDMLLSKGKLTELFNEYQQSLEKNRTVYKQKTDELSQVIESVKTELREKQDSLAIIQKRQKLLEEKLVQMQIEYGNLKDKLELKVQIANVVPRPNISMDASNQTDLLGDNSVEPTTPINKPSTQSYKLLLVKLEQLGKENRDMQVILIHEKAEAQMAKTYKMQAEQLQIQNRDMQLRIQQLHQQISEMARHMKQPSEIASITSTIKSSVRRDMGKQFPTAGEINAQIEAQNIRISAENIALQKELDLCERIKEQHNTRIKELKAYIDQLEKANEDLQNIISAKMREMDNIRSVADQKIRLLEDDARVLEADMKGQIEAKTIALKKLEDTINQPNRRSIESNQSAELDKMAAKLEDLRIDFHKKELSDNKALEEHRITIAILKEQLETADIELLKAQELARAQAAKIRELELDVETGQQELLSQVGSEAVEHRKALRSESQQAKIKDLESVLLESQMAKAGLERHLKTAEDNISRLMNQTSDMFAELQAKKNELAKLIGIYEERIKEQDIIIANYEKQRKDPFEGRRSDIKSHNSALKSLGQQHEEQGGEDLENVQLIFDKADYSKFRRRKDQVKLLQRTGQYIKKLKQIISDKNKKIKVLEKRIQSLRNGPKFHRSISYNENPAVEEVEESDNSIKDNYSEKMQRKKNYSGRRMKQLEDETKLVVQQNNLLLQQVENLQDELARAQEQQNGLVRMKQIYKEQIAKLRNIVQEKQDQVANLRRMLETNGIRCPV